MDRKKEIEIIIDYLKKEVENCFNSNKTLVTKTIIDNGKLLELYYKEYHELTKK